MNAQCQVANAGPSRTLCVGSVPVMAANTATGGGIGTWTKISGSGVITSPNSAVTTITGLTAGISTFMWTITNGTCSTNSSMSFTVGPSTSLAGPNQTVCASGGSALLAGNNPVVGTGLWVKVSGSGTITNPNQNNSTITGLTTGTTVLTWSVSFSSCPASVSNMTIVTKAPPTVSNAGPSQTLCATTGTASATLAGNNPAVGTGIWVLVSGSGTITNPLVRNTTVTNISPGQTVLTWSISNPPCASSVSNMTISVSAPPSISAAGPDQTVCVTSSAIMAANTPTAGTGVWSLVGGSGTIVSPNSPNTTITGLGVGNNTFRWTISNSPCANSVDNIIVVGTNTPSISNAGPNQTLCAVTGTATATLAGNAPAVGTGSWTLVSGTGTITNPLLRNTTVTNISPGVTVLMWSINNPPCTSSTSNVTITVNAPPSIASAGPDQTVCISSSATMAANTTTAGTGVWTLVGGSGTITSPNSPVTTITGLGVGNNTFQWTTSNPPCANSSDQIIIVGKAVPTIANAGPSQTICVTTGVATMAGNVPAAGTGAWIKVSGPGVITNSLLANTTVTGLTAGVTVMTWSISNPPCTSSTSNMTITTNALPTAAVAGPNQTVCVSAGATMAANNPAIGTGAWALISGSGTITNSLSPTTSITGLGVGNNVFSWTTSNPPCANSVSNVTITGVSDPSISNAGPSQTICITSPSATMAANTPTAGSGVWTLISGSGTITNSLSPTTSITGLGVGNNVFAWTISNNPCSSSTSNATITVNPAPTIASAGSNQTLCISSPTTTMNGNFPAVGNGTWTLTSGSGVITNSLLPNTTVTGLGIGNNIFQWTISNPPCANSVSNVTLTVNQIPTVANAGSNQTLCASSPTTTMNGNTALVGTGVWTLISGSGTITNSLSPTTSVTGLGVGNNVFAWTISNNPCPASSSNVTISVNQNPSAALAGSDQTLCISSPSTTMNGNFPAIGTGAWTLVSGSGVITNSLLPTTTITGLAVGTNIFQWTISNPPCTASSATMAIIVKNVPTISSAGSNQTLCASSPTTTMNGNTAVVGTGVWTLISGSGTITNSLSPTTSITGLGIGNNVFAWTISNSPCSPSTSNVTITVNQNPSIALAGSDQTLCISSPSTTMNGNFPAIGTGAWTLVSGSGVITNSLLPTTTITGLAVGTNIFQWTISNPPCTASSATMAIIVKDVPTISTAGANQTICISSPNTIMAANSPVVGSGVWTLVSGSGTITNSLSPTTSITGLSLGTSVFAWTISNSPCSASSSTMSINVKDIPTVANAGSNQTLCVSSPTTTMNANAAIVGTGVWTLVSGSGTITNSLSPTTSITGLGLGTNVLAWTISNNPCTPSSSNVTITVNQAPSIANAGPNQTLCISSPNTLMAANAATVGTGVWTLISGSGTITNSLSPTTSITGLGVGNNVFAWTISNAPCAPSVSNVTITVNQVPTIANAGSNQTLCISSPTTTMNANSAIVGTGVWTLVSGSGTITNSLSPTTSITGLGLGTNIFAWTISNNPCTPSSSNVTITVNQAPSIANAGPNQTLCISSPNTLMAANAATVGTGVWTLISGSGTITNSLSPTTSITGLGLGTNVFAWTISNAPCAPSVSNVTITVNQVPTIANAGASQTLCISSPNTVMAANAATVGTGVWTLVSGTGVITNSLSPTTSITGLGLGTNVFQWTISNTPCPASSSTMAIVVKNVPTIANAGTNQTLCSSSPNTFMTANTATVGTGVWTLVSGSGMITNSLSPTTSITGLGVGNNVFAWTISNSPCAPSISNVTITVNQIPTIASAGSNQTLCISSPTTVMTANAAVVGTGAWTLVSGSGTITNSLSPTTSITGIGLGTNIFQWTISNAPCAQSSSTMSIIVKDVPTIANAGTNQTLCISSPNTFMTANTATVGTGVWTLVSGSGTITNSLSPTTSITGLGLGTNIFQWTISNAPCASSSSTVAIIVNDVPTVSNAGVNQTVCFNVPTATMTANTPIVGTGAWTLISGSGTITNSLSPTTSITSLGLGTNVFAWTISNAPCAPSVSNMTIMVNPGPTISNAGPNQTVCISSPNATMAGNIAASGTGQWTLVSGTGIITNSLSPSTTITGLGLGTNVFAWTIYDNPCIPSSSTVAIVVKDVPTIANAGASQTLCISSPTTVMTANTATVGTGVWTLVSGTGVISNSLSPTTSITGLAIGTNIFEWTISNSPCSPSSSTVAIIVKDIPSVSNAGPTQTLCISTPTTIMAANTPTVGTGVWTLVSGTGIISNSISPTTAITGLAVGTNVFAWTISNSPCSPSSSTVALIVNDIPTIASAGPNQTVCITSPNAVMAGNTPTVGTGVWTIASGSGTITTPNSPTTTVTNLAVGNNILVWTISNAPCASSNSSVTIRVRRQPTPSVAGPDQTLCISTPTTVMAGNTPTVGNGAWTLVSGTGVISNSTSPTTNITGLATGTNVFAWTVSNSPCAPSSSTMAIIVNGIPTTANAGASQTLCISSPTTVMTANAATTGTGAWTLISGSGVITNSLSPTTSITGLGLGTNVFAWTISNSPCAPSSSTVAIVVKDVPTVSNAGPNQILCISSPNTLMAANSPIVGTGVWTLVSGSGTITNSLSPTTSITGLGLGTNVFAWTISNSPCAASVSNVTITVNQVPTISNAGASQTLCISSPTTNMIANTALVGTGTWSLVSGTGVITNSLSPTTSVTGLAIGTNIFAWTISNPPCAASTSTMAIIVEDAPTLSNAGPSQTICISTPNAVMAANAPVVGTGAWTLVSGIGTISNSLSPTSSIFGLGVGTNVFAWTISNPPCASSTSTMAIEVMDLPTTSNAGASQTLCISSPTTVMTANTATIGTGVWTLVSGSGVITNSLSPTTSITGLGLGTNVFAWTISNSPCSSSSSTVAVVVKDVPTVSNAGPNQILCITSPSTFMAANSATVGTGVWTLVSGSGTITNSLSPTTSITGLGLGTNVFAWTISNSPCAASVSNLTITVNQVPTIANAGATQTLCISSPTTNMTANTALVGTGTWSLVSGTGIITNSLSPTTSITGLGLGTNVFAWTISNPPCTSSTSTVALIVNDVPTISNAGISQTVCVSSPNAILNANTPTVGTGVWTLISGSGTITNSLSPTTSVTGLGLGINVFQWTITNPPCAASSSTVSLRVNALPTIANAGTTQTLCISSPSTTMAANTPTVGTGLWTLVSGSGTIANPNLENTTISGLGLGTNVFAWTISNPPCTSSTATVALIVNDIPTVSNAGPTQTLCITSPNTTMAANTPIVGTGVWTLLAGSGAITTPTSPNTTITGLGLGANVFEWAISNSPCLTSVSSVTIFVDDKPTPANAGPSQNLCASNFTLTGNAPSIGTGLWTVIIGGSSVTTPTLNNSQVTGLITGTNTLVWTISNGVCASSSSTIDLYVNPFPTPAQAGPDQTICTSTAVLAGNTPTIGFGSWTVINGGGTVLTNTLSNSPVSGLTNGLNTFVWTTAFGTCPNSPDTVNIFVDSLPTTAIAGINQIICSPNATLSANIPTVGIGTWSVISGGSSVTTPTLNSSGVTGLSLGSNILQWSIVNGVCPASSNTMSIFVDTNPTTAGAGTDFTICASTATLNSNIPSIGTGIWSVVTGTSSVTTPTLNTSSVTSLSNGVNLFVWTTSNGTCPNSTDTVMIFVDSFPTVSIAGLNQTICSSNTTLSANAPIVGTGTWSVIAGGSSVITPTLNSSGVTGLALGTNIFEWSVVNGVCPASTSTVSVFVDTNPTPSSAGTDFTICASTATLNSNIPSVGTGSWTVISGGSSVTTPTLNTSSVTGLTTGINSLEWTTSNGTCPNSTSTVNIQVDAFPSSVSAGPDQLFCLTTTTANLNATIPPIGATTWSVISGGGTVTTTTLNSSAISGLTSGTNSIVWTNTNGVCPATSDTVNIILMSFPTTANAGPDQIICPNSTVLAGNLPSIGMGTWSVISGTGSVSNPTLNTSGATALSTGTNTLVWTTSNSNCPTSSDTVIVIVLPPVQQAYAGNDTIIYVTSVNINGNVPTSGTGQWQFVGGGFNIVDPNQSSTQLTNLTLGVNTIKWTITETCGTTEDELNITLVLLELPNAFSPNGDGMNDYFEIPLADYFKQVELKIVNRWGNVEFEDHDYKNKWNGNNQDGKPLTEDTYFYVVKLDDITKTGYVLIKR